MKRSCEKGHINFRVEDDGVLCTDCGTRWTRAEWDNVQIPRHMMLVREGRVMSCVERPNPIIQRWMWRRDQERNGERSS